MFNMNIIKDTFNEPEWEYMVQKEAQQVAYRILVSAQALVTITEPESLSLSH